LEVQDLAFGYGTRMVGSGVSLTLRDSEALCLLGPNG
jgi:iron complex transport system ATP-binding protein